MKLQNIIAGILAAMLMLGTLGPAMGQSSIASTKSSGSQTGMPDLSFGAPHLDMHAHDAAARAAAELEMLQKLQASSPGLQVPSSGPFTLEAGPIWSTNDAKQICPRVCSARSAAWTSQWWTTVPGKMSVCQCK